MIPNEITIKSDRIYEGKMIQLRVDTVLLPGEKQATREIVEHPGAVAIVPITEDNKIIMVKQFRKPVESILLEVPAGKIDKDEEPLSCAIRELKEETGYEAKNMQFLFSFYTSPGFSNERIYLYLAKDLIKGKASPDEDEHIEMECIDMDKLVSMVYDGKIKDSKTILAILAAKDLLK
ncbi:NUDIX hydrolase [Crassaminicella indica]|uniref:NUDIX hydrolase n=1 Tax=Crassaminicella indica TaxID=2855394 RepID=A0ABX8RC89_9CLOT|nr:NUDIX hydrolase [Crassaminicella indica]QXM06077.1 NUDIX hydrolase [Crassaminicella indica]